MQVPREVILDLLPLYLAGELNPATKAFVEEYLAGDPELAKRVRLQWEENARETPLALPPELELESLRKTRRLLGLQKWLFGLAIGFTVVSFTSEFAFEDGRVKDFHFLIRDYPVSFGACMALALFFWIAYHRLHRRLRATTL